MTGPKISTARSRESEANKKAWEERQTKRLVERRERFGEKFENFDDVGDPVFSNQPIPRSMRGPEFVKALDRAFIATGDPIFDDARRALQAYGLDKGGHGRVYRQTWGDSREGALVQVRYMVDRKGMSVPSAAEHVCVELALEGSNFDAIVQELSKAYRAWKKAGYPREEVNADAGDLGYMIEVAADHDVNLDALIKPLLNKTNKQPATTYWRRLFREGCITVRYLGEKARTD